jgi:hypothetical protein
MFLPHKPARGSLLDFMGSRPVHILVAAVMFLALAARPHPRGGRHVPGARGVGTAHLGALPNRHDRA